MSEDDRLMYQVVIGVLIFVLFAGAMLIEWEKIKADKIAEEKIYSAVSLFDIELDKYKKQTNNVLKLLIENAERMNRLHNQIPENKKFIKR